MADLDIFKYEKAKNRSNVFDFVSTGHLIKSKRMDLTISAFSKAFKKDENVRLTIFGHGVEEAYLNKLVNDLDLADRVYIMGQTSRAEISHKYNESDCFVLATQTETFGVAYIEALAAGLPVIATRSGGPEVFVNDINGILIDVDDENQLIDSMRFMYNRAQSYDHYRIAEDIKNKYSSDKIASMLIDIYNEAMSSYANEELTKYV